ncbi:Sugar transporter domain containing protein [Elaphomyces granulatus]
MASSSENPPLGDEPKIDGGLKAENEVEVEDEDVIQETTVQTENGLHVKDDVDDSKTGDDPDNQGGRRSPACSRSSSNNPSHAKKLPLDTKNPLSGLTNSQLAKEAHEFIKFDEGLKKHTEFLIFGAQLAGDKELALGERSASFVPDKESALGKNTELSSSFVKAIPQKQIDYLEKGEEKASLWGQSKYLKCSLLIACLAGIIQGWTQSVINGASIGIDDEFNIHNEPNDPQRTTPDIWLFGVLNAVPFLAGGVLAPLIADPLQYHLLGRRGAIQLACICSIAATIGQAFSKSTSQLIGCRVVTGVTLAAKASSAPLLIAEVSPNHLRGNFLSLWQLSDAFGIFLGFSSNLAILSIYAPDTTQWRIQTATILIPTIVLTFLVYFVPESPRVHMKHGRLPKALETFTLIRPSPVSEFLAARDLVYAHVQLEIECTKLKNEDAITEANGHDLELQRQEPKIPMYDVSRTNFFHRLLQTFKDGRSRRALVCASTAMISQQLTGINTIAFMSALLLKSINDSPRSGAWLNWGIGLCNFLFGLPAFWLLDRVGRSTMLLLGFIPMSILMLVLAFSFEPQATGDPNNIPLAGVFGILFVIAYSPTAGTSPFAISAEVFPLVVREVGHSLSVAVNFIGLGLVLLFFPSLSSAMGGYRQSLSLFAALNLLAFGLCYLFVPETKDMTLEELRTIFDIPTARHIQYRLTVVTPWLVKKYLRSWAVKLHLWRKPSAEDDDSKDDLITFPDWYKLIEHQHSQNNGS